MSDQNISSELLTELSAEDQELLSGGHYWGGGWGRPRWGGGWGRPRWGGGWGRPRWGGGYRRW
ncbi:MULTISPECIES: hypothetical protein [unclassified Anabaena]|uniref:hypothetical protein n=1 Tax=unclassified Anabaena TaxID=2619674 RepID=UPI001444B7CF|nr:MULTISPECIES: hypothetical protein [unclassified Anabaena]MTJ07644.1 hypothetical protein [Anabaena sp. UHCC 0204]MTJ51388.1 hypothetical protein [Anabaena sp. UHCC 0253]